MRGIFKRHERYWFRFSWEGKQRFVNLDTDHESDAINRALEVLKNPAEWVSGSDQIGSLLAKFLELKSLRGVSAAWTTEEKTRLQAFFRDWHIKHPTEITSSKITQWMDGHWKRNQDTGNSYRASLARFTRWLKDHGHISTDPCEGIPRRKAKMRVRRRFLSREECRKMLDLCTDPDLKLCLYLALHCGLRKGECLQVAPHWVDLRANLLHVTASKDWEPKDRDNRTIPLTREFAEFLKPYADRKPYLVRPDVVAGISRYRWNFRKPFVDLIEEAGIECTFHDLRRTFASLHVSAGTSVFKVAKWLGDGVVVVENHYGHLIPNDEEINRAWE
jgi:integrase